MKKIKVYQIRLNLKSRVAGTKLKPSYMTGLVGATSEKEATECALNYVQNWLDSKNDKVDVTIGRISRITSSFILNAVK